MTYRYDTVSGNHAVEVDERLYGVLRAMDREAYNADRRFRRHNPVSLSHADYDGKWMQDDTDVLGDLIRAESRAFHRAALAQLTLGQRRLIEQIFFNREKVTDVARRAGVSEAAIRCRLQKIYSRMRKMANRGFDFGFFEAI